MKQVYITAAILAFGAIPFSNLQASFRTVRQSTDQRTIVLKLSDLRSAYLQRAGIVRYDQNKLSPDGVRLQLQRHFDVVIGLLLVATPRSIETALVRLETAGGHTWSAKERGDRRQQLLAMRYLQIRRIATYRDRGVFPLNEGQASRAVPIFVDRHDTACAVGQLMRWSNWEREVSGIEQRNNFVYVPDAVDNAIVTWILESGLTIEEAALTQPGYPNVVPNSFTDYSPGALSFSRDGLRYENFQLMAENYNANTSLIDFVCPTCNIPTLLQLGLITPQVGGTLPNQNAIGFAVGTLNANSLGGLYLNGTNWLIIGGRSSNGQFGYDRGIQGAASSGHAQRIVIQFDLSTTDADTVLNQLTQHSNYFGGSFYLLDGFGPPSSGDAYSMTTRVLKGLSEVDSTTLDQTTPYSPKFSNEKISTINFTSERSIHVQTELWLLNGIGINSFALDFRVTAVPEPNSACLVFVTGMLLIFVRRARNVRS